MCSTSNCNQVGPVKILQSATCNGIPVSTKSPERPKKERKVSNAPVLEVGIHRCDNGGLVAKWVLA